MVSSRISGGRYRLVPILGSSPRSMTLVSLQGETKDTKFLSALLTSHSHFSFISVHNIFWLSSIPIMFNTHGLLQFSLFH